MFSLIIILVCMTLLCGVIAVTSYNVSPFNTIFDGLRPKHQPIIDNVTDSLKADRLLRKSSLEARAIPNKRLKVAFGIDNAFTTSDPDTHRQFLTLAKARLAMHNGIQGWKDLVAGMEFDILNMKTSMANREDIDLEAKVQTFVFRAVLRKFLPDTQPLPSDVDIQRITRKINTQWILSKKPSSSGARIRIEELAYELREDISDTLGRDLCAPEPLNIILPAYETLWRVVLRGFLEVRFRASPTKRRLWLQVFQKFKVDPSVANFETLHDRISAKFIAFEALRLYPPTRRIYRAKGDILHRINVEHIHRNPNIWGKTARIFNPARFYGIDRELLKSFIPFGAGTFVCPAQGSFGPMIIALFVGILTEHFDDHFELVDRDGNEVEFGDIPLNNERDGYENLRLRRRWYP